MNLSKDQEEAVKHLYGPALVLAVPGAGKTTVLIHRTINLIQNHKISPERILSITFSRASALDMKDRFNEYFKELSSIPVNFSTIHSFCYSLIREYAYMNKKRFTLIEDDKNRLNKYNLLKKIYLDTNKEYITEEKLESLLNSIGYIKNMMLDIDSFVKLNKPDIDNFKIIYNAYEKYKRNNDLIDFDDMLTIALHILQNNKYILGKYRSKYDFIQVDEGQDTSKVQMEVVKTLALPNNNLFLVADDDQSIYGFRGAYPKGLFQFNKDHPKGKLFFMEQNYRSSKNIVSVSNRFIKGNTLRYNKNIYTENKFMEPINIVKFDNIIDQYEYLANELKGGNFDKSAVLYRNNLSSIGLMEFLQRNNIPFNIRDTKLRFFNHWLLSDIINFMIFSKDTSNIEIYEKIYYKKKGYISRKMINYAKTLNYNISVFDRIHEYPDLPPYYRNTIRDLKYDFNKLSKLNPIQSIDYIEKKLEYDKYLKENSIKFGYTYDVLKTTIYFLKLIASKLNTTDELVNRLKQLEYISKSSRDNKNAVTLSTVHSSKGLEFDRIYMVDLVDGDFPSISSIEAFEKGNFELIEEERRLFYVGMTRARYHLSLITVNNIGEKQLNASRFLTEIEEKRA